ncbi:MAG TPA: tautomerase family protein, partial [Arthrobacter sp.]|nr:tautomerase family protein [Arthrobacter sp.]
MPLVRIDVNQGRTPKQLQMLSRGVHDAIVAEYRIPERDYLVVRFRPGAVRHRRTGCAWQIAR